MGTLAGKSLLTFTGSGVPGFVGGGVIILVRGGNRVARDASLFNGLLLVSSGVSRALRSVEGRSSSGRSLSLFEMAKLCMVWVWLQCYFYSINHQSPTLTFK